MRAVRWSVALLVSAGAFLLLWWLWSKYEWPPEKDRQSVALAVAAAVASLILAPLGWWAGRDKKTSAAEKSSPVRVESGSSVRISGSPNLGTATISPIVQHDSSSMSGIIIGSGASVQTISFSSTPVPPSSLERLVDFPLVYGNIPRTPPGFQERKSIINKIDDCVSRNAGRPIALVGGRGVGKTQIAASYARKSARERWKVIAWVPAENRDQIVLALGGLAERVGAAGLASDAEQRARAALDWVSRLNESCLLIYDNVRDTALVEEFLPDSSLVHVLLTTTEHVFAAFSDQVLIAQFSEAESVQLLHDMTDLEPKDDEASRLARDLGYLPLALAQAAWVIRRKRISYQAYRERLASQSPLDVLDPVPGHSYPQGAPQALLLAINVAEEEGRPEGLVRSILEVISLLSPDGAPSEIVRAGVAKPGLGDSEIDDALADLANSSLIALNGSTGAIVMHRLIQRVIRDRAATQETFEVAVRRSINGLRAHYLSTVTSSGVESRSAAASAWYIQVQPLMEAVRAIPTAVPRSGSGIRALLQAEKSLTTTREVLNRVSIFQSHVIRHLVLRAIQLTEERIALGAELELDELRLELVEFRGQLKKEIEDSSLLLGREDPDVTDLRADLRAVEEKLAEWADQ